MGKIRLQIMLSDVGQSNFKRLVVFCTEKERKDLVPQKKILKSIGHGNPGSNLESSCISVAFYILHTLYNSVVI
jgi:hypothetical protein